VETCTVPTFKATLHADPGAHGHEGAVPVGHAGPEVGGVAAPPAQLPAPSPQCAPHHADLKLSQCAIVRRVRTCLPM
jgi:hypothetical protein